MSSFSLLVKTNLSSNEKLSDTIGGKKHVLLASTIGILESILIYNIYHRWQHLMLPRRISFPSTQQRSCQVLCPFLSSALYIQSPQDQIRPSPAGAMVREKTAHKCYQPEKQNVTFLPGPHFAFSWDRTVTALGKRGWHFLNHLPALSKSLPGSSANGSGSQLGEHSIPKPHTWRPSRASWSTHR